MELNDQMMIQLSTKHALNSCFYEDLTTLLMFQKFMHQHTLINLSSYSLKM